MAHGRPPARDDVARSVWQDDVRHLLRQRVVAFESQDVTAWLATGVPQTAGTDVERWDALQRMPVTEFTLTIEESEVSRGPEVRVRTSYRLGAAPVAEHVDDVDLVATAQGWRLGASRPAVPVTDGGTLPPWYLPGAAARQGVGGDLVLVWPGTRHLTLDLLDMTDIGIAAARQAVPGSGMAGIVVAVPGSAADYRALVPGDDESGSGFAAVTADVPGRGGGDIVVLNPGVWPVLDALEQQVVLTHELVHVAVGATVGGGQPLWLAEGHADHVALAPVLASGVTRQELAGPGLAAVAPPALPEAAQFATDADHAYRTSWLFVDYLVRAYGERAVLDLVARLAGTGQGAVATGAEDRTLRQVTGLDRAQLVQRWQADLVSSPVPDPAVGRSAGSQAGAG